jgi:multidrug resistance efflux pump
MLRFGGNWLFRWTARIGLLGIVAALGFLPYSHEVGGHCHVVAGQEVALRAQLSDEIEKIAVADGDIVEQQMVVATLAGREERAALESAEADVQIAQANLRKAENGAREEDIAKVTEQVTMWKSQLAYWETEYKRQQDLLRERAASESAVQKAMNSRDTSRSMLAVTEEQLRKLQNGAREEAIDAARGELAKAHAKLGLQKEKMSLLEVRSPLRGEISTPGVKLRVGQAVAPGDVIAVVRDVSPLRLEIEADEAATQDVKVGMPVKIRLWGLYGSLLMGKVDEVALMARSQGELEVEPFRSDRENQTLAARVPETGNRYLRVRVSFDEQNKNLLPGLTGEARVVVSEDYFWNALWRPIERFFLVEVWSWLP